METFNEACDMFHPEYGWIRKENVTTEEGLKYFKDQKEKYGSSNKGYQNPSDIKNIPVTNFSKRDC